MDMQNPLGSGQVLQQKPESDVLGEQDQDTDSSYQEIYWWKGRIMDRSPADPSKLYPIDLETALPEILSMAPADPNYKSQATGYIILYNQKNLESFQILKVREGDWQVDAPVFSDDSNCNYLHGAHVDDKRLEEIVRAFFAGDDWYGLAPFKFDHELFELNVSGKYKKYTM